MTLVEQANIYHARHQAHHEVTEIPRRYFEPCFLSPSFKNGTIYQLPQQRVDSVTEELEGWKLRLGDLFNTYDGTLTPRYVHRRYISRERLTPASDSWLSCPTSSYS